MSTSTMTTTPRHIHDAPQSTPSRRGLEAEAEVAKTRLLRTLERLDEKRHHAVDTVSHVRQELIVAGVVGGLLLGVVLGELRLRTTRKKKIPLDPYRARWVALQRAWSHPERLAAAEQKEGSGKGLVTVVAAKVVAAVASALFSRLARMVLVQRPVEGTVQG